MIQNHIPRQMRVIKLRFVAFRSHLRSFKLFVVFDWHIAVKGKFLEVLGELVSGPAFKTGAKF